MPKRRKCFGKRSRCKAKKIRASSLCSENISVMPHFSESNKTDISSLEGVTSISHNSSPVISLTSSTSSDSVIDLTISPTSQNSPMGCPTSSEQLLPIDLTISPTTSTNASDTSLTSVDSIENISYHSKNIIVQSTSHHQREDKILSTKSYIIPQPTQKEENDRDIDEPPQYTVGGGFVSPSGKPLLFFYDCESTGGNIHYDHIVEIAAVVIEPDNVNISVKSFSELCYTPQPICGIGCGVTGDMLVGKREFSAVFPAFLSWIQRCVAEAKEAAGQSFYPVLVAHYGFFFDFRLLTAEVERRKLMVQFLKADLVFADTGFELRKMRRADDLTYSNWSPVEQRRLSIDNLLKKCYPQQQCERAHRALEDVQLMTKLFIKSDQLTGVLQSLTMISTIEIICDWRRIHETYSVWKEAQCLYGSSRVTKSMAKYLKNYLSYEMLEEMYRRCPSQASFDKMMRDSGVVVKSWREVLWNHFLRKKKQRVPVKKKRKAPFKKKRRAPVKKKC